MEFTEFVEGVGTFLAVSWPHLLSTSIALLALTISALTYRAQVMAVHPSVMAAIVSYENGPTVAITMRNRATHPMAISSIAIRSKRDVVLALVESVSGKPPHQSVLSSRLGVRRLAENITLASSGSANKSDRAKREYALLSSGGLPSTFWIEVRYDPSDGRKRTKIAKREVAVPRPLVGHVTAVAFPTEAKQVRYSVRAPETD